MFSVLGIDILFTDIFGTLIADRRLQRPPKKISKSGNMQNLHIANSDPAKNKIPKILQKYKFMKTQLARITTAVLVNLLIATSILAMQPRSHATRSFDDSKHVQEIFALHAAGEDRLALLKERNSQLAMVKAMKKEKSQFTKELAKNDMLDRYSVRVPANSGKF